MTFAAAQSKTFNSGPPDAEPEKKILFGRFMMPDQTEHACQVAGLSSSGATFLSSYVPQGGQTIVAYIEDLGRIEAISAAPVSGGFNVMFSLSAARREKFEARLKVLASGVSSDAAADGRRHARFEPKDSKSHLTLPDGRVYACEVLDISLSGAAVKVDVLPSLGTFVLLGKMRGRIVRYLDTGMAIEFVKPLERTSSPNMCGKQLRRLLHPRAIGL